MDMGEGVVGAMNLTGWVRESMQALREAESLLNELDKESEELQGRIDAALGELLSVTAYVTPEQKIAFAVKALRGDR